MRLLRNGMAVAFGTTMTLFVACGGSTAGVGSDAGGGGSDGSTSSDARAGGDSGSTSDSGTTLSPACPVSAPADQSACSVNGLECEYGDFTQLSCDTIATCGGDGKWSVSIASDCHDLGVDAAACPSSLSDIPAGEACDDFGLACKYATGECDCTIDHSGAPQIWTCYPTTGCPFPRPRLGQTCSTDGLQCDYSTCGASVMCSGGTWKTGNGGCHP